MREWAYNQGAAEIVQIDDDERLSLAPEAVAVLADEEHPAFGMGSFHHLPADHGRRSSSCPESFRTGLGLDYDAHGPDCAEGIARGFEPWMRANLLPDGAARAGRRRRPSSATAQPCSTSAAAPVGSSCVLAAAFPASRITGYDISQHALARARERQAEAGVTNASFADPRQDPMPTDGSADFVVTFDCLHDMTDPAGMVNAIRAALADDGTWLLVDIKAHDTFAENVERNPMASLMYGISVLSCMSSALSEPGGAGLGTLGLSAAKAEQLARDAGFTRFRPLDIDHPINAFYEIRP